MADRGHARRNLEDTMVMHTLGVRAKKSREQMRFERATKDAVRALLRRRQPIQDLTPAIRRCLNDLHGAEWHCVVGKVKAFSVHVRYWRGKALLIEDAGLKILIFRSAPPAPETPLAAKQQPDVIPTSPEDTEAYRPSVKVLRSEMGQVLQKRVLSMALDGVRKLPKDKDLDTLVAAVKASLTEFTGPAWHVVATRGAGEWSVSVAHEPEQLLDFKLNGDRLVVWKHAQAPPTLGDLITVRRISWALIGVTVLLLCFYVKVQRACDVCCSSHGARRASARCPEAGAEEELAMSTHECREDAKTEADRCLLAETVIFYVMCGTLAVATALKWSDRSPRSLKTA